MDGTKGYKGFPLGVFRRKNPVLVASIALVMVGAIVVLGLAADSQAVWDRIEIVSREGRALSVDLQLANSAGAVSFHRAFPVGANSTYMTSRLHLPRGEYTLLVTIPGFASVSEIVRLDPSYCNPSVGIQGGQIVIRPQCVY